MIDEKFREECLEENSAERLKSPTMRKRSAKNYERQAKYHKKSAMNLLNTDTPLIAVVEAYYAMMHKANQALAIAGYDVKSHICTIVGLSRVLDRPDLAEKLRQAGARRLETDYELDPENPPYNFDETKRFVGKTMENFLNELENEIEELRSE